MAKEELIYRTVPLSAGEYPFEVIDVEGPLESLAGHQFYKLMFALENTDRLFQELPVGIAHADS